MAFISTFYDKTLDDTGKPIGKVFMVRGEERYARTTDTTLIEHGERREDWDESIRFFKLSLEAEVLRSMGESIISIYDNNDLLLSKDVTSTNSKAIWDYIDEEHDERLKLSYDVEHNLKAVFQGNKSCLKSESDLLTITVPTPAKYESNITVTGAVEKPESEYPLQLVLMSDDTSIDIVLNADDYYSEQTVQLYEGNTLIAETETNSNGEATFELVNPSSELHKYTVKYAGNDYLTPVSTTVYTSVGYNVQVTDYPNVLFNGMTGDITVNVKDFFNAPYEDVNVKLVTTGGSDITSYSPTDSNGNVTFNDLSFNATTMWKAVTSHGDESSVYTTQIKTNISLEIPSKITSVLNGEIVTANAQLSERIPNIPITFKIESDYYGTRLLETVSTNENGYASVYYTGYGDGSSSAIISSLGQETSYNFVDTLVDFNKKMEYTPYSRNSSQGYINELPKNVLELYIPTTLNSGKMYLFPKYGGTTEQTIKFTVSEISGSNVYVIIGYKPQGQSVTQYYMLDTQFKLLGNYTITLNRGVVNVIVANKGQKTFELPINGSIVTPLGIGIQKDIGSGKLRISGLQSIRGVIE